MTRCACPPAGPYSEMTCCRWDAEERCSPERCEHPEPTAAELFDQFQDTIAMLGAAEREHAAAQAHVQETANRVLALMAERKRLWEECEKAVVRERGVGIGTAAENGGEALLDALRGIPEAVAVEDHGG